ncbi:MAG: peptide ABC transporter substrate-binding protein [Lachnospiraceae bacterium]|nr:MAG: peptide ABC transporter substrate-binding protein [Lachnospiraceae bacterium]
MKKSLLLLAVGFVMLATAACQSSSNSTASSKSESAMTSTSESESSSKEEAKGTRIIKDQLGFDVELPPAKDIKRIAIHKLLPLPSVYAVYKGGNVDGLISMPPDSLNAAKNSILAKYAPDILNVSIDYYKGGELNMEELLKLKPDVVFYAGGEEERQQFVNAGIPAVGFSTVTPNGPNTIETLNAWISLMEQVFEEGSKVTGITEYAKEAQDEINKRLADIPEDQRKKVLMIGHYSDTNFTLGGFSDYWISVTGGINVGKGTQGNVNMEQVYSWAPDIMFISTLSDFFPEDFYNNTTVEGADWSGVPAVINKQVYKFPLGMHRWWPPSTDAPLSLWWIAKTTYPEKFEDINMDEKIKEYYKKFYGMDLTDEDVNSILNPVKGVGRTYY